MILSKFIPYEKYTLVTNLTPQEVMKIISGIFQSQDASEVLYSGEIDGNIFEATRNIKGRNSFSPIIKGTISTVLNRTEIAITVRLPITTVIFLLIWIGFTGMGCLKVLFPSYFDLKDEDKPIWFLPFLFLLFGYLLTVLSYKSESKKSKKILEMSLEIIETK